MKRVPLQKVVNGVAYCIKRVAEVRRRLEDLREALPEDGPEGALGFALRGDVECLLTDDVVEAERKLAKMRVAILEARSEGWRGDLEWME